MVTEVRGAVGPVKVADTSPVCEGSQHEGGRRTERRLTDFNVDSLHTAGCFSDVDVVSILWIRRQCQNLRGELDGLALGVLGFGCLAGSLIQGRGGLEVVSWVI